MCAVLVVHLALVTECELVPSFAIFPKTPNPFLSVRNPRTPRKDLLTKMTFSPCGPGKTDSAGEVWRAQGVLMAR